MNPVSPQLDEQFMRRAIRLAMNGRGFVEPNPMVGCVIVQNNTIIGEGFHEKFGQAHAEPNALRAAREAGHLLEGATAYVTLEPCCHINKITPPCAPALIEAKLRRVVIGCIDPYKEVRGKGAQQLRDARIQTDVGVLESECKQLIAPFTAFVVHNRPYVTLKWAQSADGKVAGPSGQRVWISNDASRHVVHQLRARSDGIMVGVKTVLLDDPQLSVRGVESIRDPAIIILDTRLRTPVHSRVIQQSEQTVYIFCSGPAALRPMSSEADQLRDREAVIVPVPIGEDGHVDLGHVLAELGRGSDAMTHILVEPGPTLARSFLSSAFADRVWVFRSPKQVGHSDAPHAPKLPEQFVSSGSLDLRRDVLTEYLNPTSDVFFAPVPSPDFVLTRERQGKTPVSPAAPVRRREVGD